PALIEPLFDGNDPRTATLLAAENPYELLNPCQHGGGKVALYAGYGGHDEFNLDAHIEAFEYRARQLGIPFTTGRVPLGHHVRSTALKLFPAGFQWLGKQLAGCGPQ